MKSDEPIVIGAVAPMTGVMASTGAYIKNGMQQAVDEWNEKGTIGSEIAEELEKVLEIFPSLKERLGYFAGSLSGGEQQLVAIGRGIMAKPKILLLDEPSLGLAPLLVNVVFDIINQINKSGTTILLVEQNASMALNIAHRGYVLENGKIILHGKASDLLENNEVKKAYLGIA